MRSAGAGVGAAVGSALDGAKFGFNDFGNQLVRGTLTGLAAGTTAAVMRGGRISVQQVATDAFGNALGSSLAGGSFNGASQNEAVLQDAGPWSERDYVNGLDLQSDNYGRPYTGGTDWATGVAMRRASYPTYAQSAPQPYGNDEFRSSERAYRSATESSTPGTSVRAGAGASISSILGTSEPQAIGNFMRANNLTTDRLEAGGTYFVPASANSYGDQQALGQGALNAGNARMAARQEAAAQAASMDQANQQRWDAMQVGAWSGRTGQGGASSMGVGAASDTRGHFEAMPSMDIAGGGMTGGTEQVWVNDGPEMTYRQSVGNALRASGQIGYGALKGVVNGVPEMVVGALKGYAYIGAGLRDGFDSMTGAPSQNYLGQAIEAGNGYSGQVLTYDGNGLQRMGGYVGELASPGAYVKAGEYGAMGLRALGPTLGAMTEGYLGKTGGILYAVPEGAGGATLGGSIRLDYAKTFFEVNPGLKGDVVVHHAIPQRAMKLYPDAITSSELHSIENLRGIPKEINSELHLKQINREWDQFYRQNATTTQQQLLNKATEIDIKYGSRFNPPVGRRWAIFTSSQRSRAELMTAQFWTGGSTPH